MPEKETQRGFKNMSSSSFFAILLVSLICNFTEAALLSKANSTSYTLSGSSAPVSAPMSSPAPVSGGTIPSSPSYEFPSLPPQGADSPGGIPGLVPQKGGGIAIIDSNPAVPLPTEAADSTSSARPLNAALLGLKCRWWVDFYEWFMRLSALRSQFP